MPKSCILLFIKMTQQTLTSMASASFPPYLGPWLCSMPCSVPCCPKPPWEDVCRLMSLLLSYSTGKSSVQRHPGVVTLLLVPGCDCTSKEDYIRFNAVWLRRETHLHLFLESQRLYRPLVFIFCRLQQVLLGSQVKVEGTGLFSLIIGVLNILQSSGVESCNPNSWEKVQTCIFSFQKMPTWISLTEVEQPQGKFSGQIISNSK